MHNCFDFIPNTYVRHILGKLFSNKLTGMTTGVTNSLVILRVFLEVMIH